jgi:phosphodiesterase/alkaline phosphatase D-like protein
LLGLETPRQPIETGEVSLEVKALLTGLIPNQTYYYRLTAEDQNVKFPELLSSEITSVVTPVAVPRIVGEPTILHVTPFSAVMFGELNPENGNTTYEFQYGLCAELDGCPETSETATAQSPIYGAIGTTMEASGLLPGRLYYYRLIAKSGGGEAISKTDTFSTEAGPEVTAQTGLASAVETTSAVVSGIVNPDGQASTYSFELGRDNGADTQFGIVVSASAGKGSVPVEESHLLSGLQPGTRYAYRIAIRSGDGSAKGETATGEISTFTTQGSPSTFIPVPPTLVAVPRVPFPKEEAQKHPTSKELQLTSALKACKKKPKKRQASCESKARKRYGTSNKKKTK